MKNYAEYIRGPSLTFTTPGLAIVTASPSYLPPDLVVKDQIIVYNTELSDTGAIIIDEPSLNYNLQS